jgi:hypothetical protein
LENLLHPDLLDLLGFDDRQTGARAILLAGLLDRLIYKYRFTPDEVAAAGIPLRHLLPADTILRFPTERLNHLIRSAKSAYVDVASNPLLALWLEKWDELLPSDLRLQVDPTNDRSHLVEPEYLVALFGSELRPLGGISIKRRGKPFYALVPRLPIFGAGSLSYRNKNIPPPPDIPDVAANGEASSRLVVFGPTDARLDALSSYLGNEARTSAAAAIFLQGTAERHEVTVHLLHAAMEKSGLAFAAAVRVHPDDTDAWMNFLAPAYLRHGNLDEVLMQAFHQLPARQRDVGDLPPLVLVGEGFLDRDVTDPRKYIDTLLEEQTLEYREFSRVDAHGAAPMAEQLSELKHIPAVRKALKKRYVQLNVRPEGEDLPVTVLYPASSYTVELCIDGLLSRSFISSLPLQLDGMSFESGPEELTIAFVPLYRMSDTQHTAGPTAKLHLPEEGPSTSVTFSLRTPDILSEFRVRIVVAHRSAVLQTLILGLEPIAGDPDMGLPFRIVVESDVTRANSIARPEALEFDLTLVLNDNPAGTPGATVIDDKLALFTEPQGWQQFIEDTQNIIGVLTDAAELPDSLDDADLNATLRNLAWAGITALEKLTDQAPGVNFSSARNIQVIEAVNGAFIPIEFFYDGPPPNDDAYLCDKAASALKNGACDAACAGNLSEATICPLSFWGMTKRIERRRSPNGSRDIELRIPKTAPPARRTLNTALLGASVKVLQPDYDHLHDRLLSHLDAVYCASNWQAWRSTVTDRQPEMLVLLPHTGPHPLGAAQLSMEIHTDYLRFAQLQGKDVTANTDHDPVVLLLGCDTAVTKRLQLMNFASKFYANGAFVVIATLSAVRGRHVAKFAAELTERLKSNAPGTTRDFGTTFLALKRELLAAGNALGLTMIAYGDTAWEIEHE